MISSAVLIDMDGTLVDSEPSWLAGETELMAEFGYQWRTQDQANCLGGPLDRVGNYMSDLVGGIKSGQFFTDSLIELVAARFQLGLNLMPGSLELLENLHSLDIPMALVSASPRVLVQSAINALPKPFFQVSISSSDVLNTKPHPEPFLNAASLLGKPIATCLILEDSWTGVSSAIASGARVVAIPHLVAIPAHPQVRQIPSLRNQTLSSLDALFF
jgi:HAD superfamily hydrolase (TIGR01509 family)